MEPGGRIEKFNDDTTAAPQKLPVIAANKRGRFSAAWWDGRRGYEDTYFSCRESNDAWSMNERINDISMGHWSPSEHGPALAIDGGGAVYALWEDYRAGNWDIYFAYRPPSGTWQGHTKINDDLITDQFAPALSVDPAGDLTAVWWDKRDGNGSIYSDYRPAGGGWGTDTRVDDDTSNNRQEYPDVAMDAAGRSHAIWQDYRGGGVSHVFSSSAPAPDGLCIVTSAADSGPGTLRTCLTDPQPGQTIRFNLSLFLPTAPATITLLSALPAITTDGISIDASSAGVVLDGHLLTGLANGLYVVGAANVVVRGLQILGFPGDGIELNSNAAGATIGGDRGIGAGPLGQGNLISGNKEAGIKLYNANSNTVLGNLVGTDRSGMKANGNGGGIAVESSASRNVIGGTSASTRNVVSGNTNCGILLNTNAGENRIAGNLIGTNAVGRGAVGNGWWGVCIWNGASLNIIGGSETQNRNIISGNVNSGLTIGNSGVISNTISGNFIGTDIDGMFAVANGYAGIEIVDGARYNVIGGVEPSQRNLISGNQFEGIIINDTGTAKNSVIGNYIGTNITGKAKLSNGSSGLLVFGGASDNVIGGSAPGQGNLISGNSGHGVVIEGQGTQNNRVEANLIGIAIGSNQVVPNAWTGILIQKGAQGSVIRSNLVSGNDGAGIWVRGSSTSGNVLAGNKIGTSASGTLPVPNKGCGVLIDTGASNNRIGGPGSAESNLVSGNNTCGIRIDGPLTSNNVVMGNLVGTDIDGSAALPNLTMGVSLSGGASLNVVGGLAASERNVISGNGADGILVGALGTERNVIIGNFIGTDRDGQKVVRNAGNGIAIVEGASNNLLDRNLVSGNGDAGVDLSGAATSGNKITGNKIGTNISGRDPLGNQGNGISVSEGATDSTIGPNNIIAYNLNGVYVDGVQTLRHTITWNSIFDNQLAGVKLDHGGNGGITPPQIIGAACIHANGSAARPNAVIEVMSDSEDEGEQSEATATATAFGVWEVRKSPPGFSLPHLTATQTDSAGNTSEFSSSYLLPACMWNYLPLVVRMPSPTPTPTPTASPSPTPTPSSTPTPIFEGPWEVEPNSTPNQANGPLQPNRDYFGLPDDERDYFYFNARTPGQIVVDLTNHLGRDVQLHLFYQDTSQRVGYRAAPPYHISYFGQPGRYIVYIYTAPGSQSSNPYTLRVSFP